MAARQIDRRIRRWREGETDRRRDGGTEGRRDGVAESDLQNLSVSPSLCLSFSPSLCLSILTVLWSSVTRLVIHPAVARLLRRREEREHVAERDVVRIDVVAQRVL